MSRFDDLNKQLIRIIDVIAKPSGPSTNAPALDIPLQNPARNILQPKTDAQNAIRVNINKRDMEQIAGTLVKLITQGAIEKRDVRQQSEVFLDLVKDQALPAVIKKAYTDLSPANRQRFLKILHDTVDLTTILNGTIEKKYYLDKLMLTDVIKWLEDNKKTQDADLSELDRLRQRYKELVDIEGEKESLYQRTGIKPTADQSSEPITAGVKILVRIILEGYRQGDDTIAEKECNDLIAIVAFKNIPTAQKIYKSTIRKGFQDFTRGELYDLFNALHRLGLAAKFMYAGDLIKHRNGDGTYFLPESWGELRHAEASEIPADELMNEHERTVLPKSIRHVYRAWERDKITENLGLPASASETPEINGEIDIRPAEVIVTQPDERTTLEKLVAELDSHTPGNADAIKIRSDELEIDKIKLRHHQLPFLILIESYRTGHEQTPFHAEFLTKALLYWHMNAKTRKGEKYWYGQVFDKLNREDLNTLFEALYAHGKLAELIAAPSFMPSETRIKAKKWLKERANADFNKDFAPPSANASVKDLRDILSNVYLNLKNVAKDQVDDLRFRVSVYEVFMLAKIILQGDVENADTSMERKELISFLSFMPFDNMDEKEIGSLHRHFDNVAQALMQQLEQNQLNLLFSILHKHGNLQEDLSEDDLFITGQARRPSSFRAAARNWLKERTPIGITSESEPEAEIPIEEVSQIPEQPIHLIEADPLTKEAVEQPDILTVVEVDRLPFDADGKKIGPTLQRKRREPDEEIPIRIQPRIDWVIDALKRDGFHLRDIIMYKEREEELSFEDAFDEEAYKKSRYRILEISKDHHYFQVAVAETVGKATYVIREPLEFSDGDEVEIEKLKLRPDVFQISCYSSDQLVRQIRRCAYTPLEELQEQLKTRIGWADKKDAVIQIVGNYYLEVGTYPPTGGQYIVDLKPHYKTPGQDVEEIEVLTTFRRMYHAIQNHAIAGLGHVSNFRELIEDTLGPVEPIAPSKPKLPFDAIQVFRDAAQHLKDTGTFPEELDLSENLSNRIVSGMELVITGDISAIRTTADFMIASGLGVEANDNIVPASPAVVNQLVRLAELIAPKV